MLKNSLGISFDRPVALFEPILKELGLEPGVRAEVLPLATFVELSRALRRNDLLQCDVAP